MGLVCLTIRPTRARQDKHSLAALRQSGARCRERARCRPEIKRQPLMCFTLEPMICRCVAPLLFLRFKQPLAIALGGPADIRSGESDLRRPPSIVAALEAEKRAGLRSLMVYRVRDNLWPLLCQWLCGPVLLPFERHWICQTVVGAGEAPPGCSLRRKCSLSSAAASPEP